MSENIIEKQEIIRVKLALSSISVFRNLIDDNVLKNFYNLLDFFTSEHFGDLNKSLNLYNAFYFSLIESTPSLSFKEYIIDKVIFDENRFSSIASIQEFNLINNDLKKAVSNDLNKFQIVTEFSPEILKGYLAKSFSLSEVETDLFENLPSWEASTQNSTGNCSVLGDKNIIISYFLKSKNWSECLQSLSNFYFENGSGIFARFNAFMWENSLGSGFLRGIENSDPITLSDLIGYHLERSEVVSNTIKFLNNLPANNVLLYGDRGTGKSSTVKAILNEYHKRGLRVIEVPKKHLMDFPEIIKNLKDKRQKFIIFVDDLAFEDNEENYTALKAVLEGGFESKPSNVVIYATSNRRHLIKEKFSDRVGLLSDNHDDEVRAADSIQEKLSLSDRFGITVVFASPDKQRYLEIVEGIAAKRGLKYDIEYLHREAMKWELWYNGRSPRTARQFVDWLEGEADKTI